MGKFLISWVKFFHLVGRKYIGLGMECSGQSCDSWQQIRNANKEGNQEIQSRGPAQALGVFQGVNFKRYVSRADSPGCLALT